MDAAKTLQPDGFDREASFGEECGQGEGDIGLTAGGAPAGDVFAT